jgi:hypothetical protein
MEKILNKENLIVHFSPADCIKEKEFFLNLNSFCSIALISDELKIISKKTIYSLIYTHTFMHT